MAKMIVNLKTFIPEEGVWVSTVAWDMPIGLHRCAESMVFSGNQEEITSWEELYFESHGYCTDEEILREEHERIVKGIKEGKIQLWR
mgnify:CR=1 FL=1